MSRLAIIGGSCGRTPELACQPLSAKTKRHRTYSEIDGATEPAYILTRKEAGKTVRVRVSFTDRHGFAESATSAATEPVPIPENSVAKGAPLITGRPWVRGTLIVDTSSVDDENGLDNVVFSYQWIRVDGTTDTEIDGATESTYRLRPPN